MNEQLDSFTNPLPQKADYDLREHFIYGNQKGWKKVIEWILTIGAWLIIISYVGYLIYGSLAIKHGWYLPEFTIYNREMVLEIQKYFYILFIAILILCVLLIFWKNYNKKGLETFTEESFVRRLPTRSLQKCLRWIWTWWKKCKMTG